MSASIFSKAAPTARIYSIDNRYGGEVGEIHSANLQDAGLGQNVQRINADSHDKATLTKFKKQEKTVDLLFVDGDHSVQGALLDLQMYSPLVKVGGMLILHDTASQTNKLPHIMHFDVTQALALFLETDGANWQGREMIDTITAFSRTK